MAKKQTKTEATPEPGREYTVVARRYRPQQFADLIGQESVAKALINAIQSDRVAHAYLFTGARGVGKTSAARILAKALNCVTGPTPTPCDKCDICLAIAAGQDVDVAEIDGASNRGIEDARAIRNNVATRPQRARYKIYIIDEVHMLTRESFNALLKTLEEPPPHVKFIFATTEVQKIPITILSRCQRFDFGGINTARILDQLKQIVTREGLAADDDALRIVARRAGGSMRDAQSLLEQLLSFGGERLTTDLVHSMLGTAADDRVVALASAILAKDATAGLDLVAKCADEGLQLGELLDQLVGYWRGLMLVSCSESALEDLDVADHHRDMVKQQARGLTLDTILAGLDVLTTTKTRLRSTSHGQVLLEMAVVRLSRLDELVPVAQLAQWLGQGGTAPATRPVAQPPQPADASKKNGTVSLADAYRSGMNGQMSAQSSDPVVTPMDDASLLMVWDKVKLEAGPMLAGQLSRAESPAIIGPKTLVLRFGPGYTREYDYCKDGARSRLVEGLLKKVTGQEWSLRFELDVAAAAVVPTTPVLSNRERERRALETPLLSRIVAGLEGRLLKMDEGFGE
ncbi:MAG TPA: DNA polymerase III subunit gamma/tau [Gemmataceae bacterium]|nr:DNA polymerase III subunit gamma/tau [Gemmataceae bacterium]